MGARQSANGAGIARLLSHHRGKDLNRVRRRASLQHLVGLVECFAQPVAAATQLRQLGDEGLYLGARQGAHETVHRLAVVEGKDRRNRLHTQLRGDLLTFVDIHLDHAHGAIGPVHRFLERWRQLAAGAAPGRPEIDDHRRLARRLDHVGHEGGVGGVLDQVAGRIRTVLGAI